MMLDEAVKTAIVPALELLKIVPTKESDCIMLAIGLQESELTHRRQIGGGPARGLWQFESGGGVKGVLHHHVTSTRAYKLCIDRKVYPGRMEAWEALEFDDVLAAGFARLLLLSDPHPLPALEQEERAWQYYLTNWRPGKPHRDRWVGNYKLALDFVRGEA